MALRIELSSKRSPAPKAGSTRSRLLGPTPVAQGSWGTLPDPPKASVGAGVVMLYKNLVGAGLLSLPSGIAATGDAGVYIMLGAGLLMCLSFWLLGYLCHCCGAESYAAIGKAALGENSTALVNACVLGNGLIALVSYLILAADFFTVHAASVSESRFAHLAWVVVVLLPLAWQKKLAGPVLTITSSLGCVAMLYVVGLIVYPAVTEPWKADRAATSCDLFSGARMFAIAVSAFTAHYNAPKLCNELGFEAFTKTVVIAFSFVVLTFIGCGVGGWLHFGAAVKGNVLASFPHDDPFAKAGSTAVTLTLLVTYPLVLSTTRDTIDNILPIRDSLWHLRVAALVAATAAVAAVLTDIAVVTAVKGATVSMLLGLGFPAIFALKLQQDALSRMLASVLLAAALGGAGCAVYTSLAK